MIVFTIVFTILHHGVVAIEKGAFRSPSTKVANFTHLHWNDLIFIRISTHVEKTPKWSYDY